jgi:hypothetical protein
MKAFLFLLLCCCSLMACGQGTKKNNDSTIIKTSQTMNTDKITHPIVKKAIDALQAADKKAWFSLFTNNAELFDDGNKMNLRNFFEKALGHERFTSIDKVEDGGLSIYGKFHSDQWGDFKTYFKFHIDTESKINRLDIGQAGY